MHKSEWTILWSGWESQKKISLKKLTQENLENSELKGLKKILFPFEKFYQKKKLKFWKVRRHGRLTKKIFFFKYSLKVFLNISETQTFLPFIEKGEKGSLSCKFHHAVMKKKTLKPNKATDMQFLAQYLENSSLLYPTECS